MLIPSYYIVVSFVNLSDSERHDFHAMMCGWSRTVFDVFSPEDENIDITRRLYEEEAKKAQQEAREHSLVEQWSQPTRGLTVCHAVQASDCMYYICMSPVIHMSW